MTSTTISLAQERNCGRRVVIAEASLGNNYKLLSAYTAGLEAEFLRRGWTVTVARANDPEFLSTLLRSGGDPEAIGLLGHFFYDLRVTAQNHFYGARIGDLFRGRLCAMWADHPFTTFMWPRLQEADPRVVYCPADPGFVDAATFLNPQLRRLHPLSLPALYMPNSTPIPLADRPIDVLIPLTFRELGTRHQYLAELASHPMLLRLAEALFTRLHGDRTNYPFAVFSQMLKAEFGVASISFADESKPIRDWVGVLSKVDLIVRNERRVELVRDLLQDTAGLKVHVVGKLPPELELPPGIASEGPLDVEVLGKRMGQSRWVVHCHPTYPGALHERVLTAMAIGCGVISDFAPVIEHNFKPGLEWLHAPPGASLRDLLTEYDFSRLEQLTTAAIFKVQDRFGMSQHVDHLLAGIETRGGR